MAGATTREEARALFYDAVAGEAERRMLRVGLEVAAVAGDQVAFDAENGGDVDRELAVPFLAGMDEVVVDGASLRLQAAEREMDVIGFTVSGTGGGDGVVIALAAPARINRIVFGPITFPESVRSESVRYSNDQAGIQTRDPDGVDEQILRIVVRPAQPQGTGFSFGPPAFAFPDFGSPGPMFGPVLAGLTVLPVTTGGFQVQLPGPTGPAWLVQLAAGDDPTSLQPKAFDATVTRVAIGALPTNLSVVATGRTPADDIVLWSNPTPLRPEAGPQDVDFQPVAQRRLTAALADAGSDAATLPVPMRFHSDTGGRVTVTSQALSATYRVKPVCPDPFPTRLVGTWVEVPLSAPARLRPRDGTAHVVARFLGRELNPGSSFPALDPPAEGLRVSADRWVAVPIAFEPAPGLGGDTLPLASAQVYLGPDGDAEVALEIREDASGAPADAPVTTVVRKLPAGPGGLVEFVLSQQAPLSAGVRLWVVLRTTVGAVRWFGSAVGDARLSVDRGRGWAEPGDALGTNVAPLAQLFHARDSVGSVDLSIVAGGAPAGSVSLPPTAGTPGEFSADVPVPEAVLALLGAAEAGSGPASGGAGCPPHPDRAITPISLISSSVVDLTVAGAALSYSPDQARGG